MKKRDTEEREYLIETTSCRHRGNDIPGKQKYCTHCGRSTADAVVKMLDVQDVPVLYGPPPVFAMTVCKNCGKKWSTNSETGREAEVRYCPHCGTETEIREWRDRWSLWR